MHLGDDVAPDVQRLRERPRGDERALHLDGELLGHVAERLQLIHVRVHADQIPEEYNESHVKIARPH